MKLRAKCALLDKHRRVLQTFDAKLKADAGGFVNAKGVSFFANFWGKPRYIRVTAEGLGCSVGPLDRPHVKIGAGDHISFLAGTIRVGVTPGAGYEC